jgi:ankyrin repeat protein
LDKTPLQHALQRGRYDIAHILIENGAAIDGITPEGHTILWLASNEGHLKDVEFLLNHDADPNSRGKGGISAISAARSSGYLSKCLFLLEVVRDHGKEYLKRPDLWNVYEFEENFRFWYQSRRRF